ncbi:hypothetical protein SLE2022_191230 [Rubroshorea leprosula]
MGTEVQSKMHLPGYYSLRDLSSDTGKVSWPLHHEKKNFEPYNNLFLTRPAIDIGCDMEQLRETILKHESIFRHQLHELHRLYRIQREMMNEMKSEELNKHLINVGTSQSSPFSSGLPFQDEQKSHVLESRMLDLNCSGPYTSGADSIQSQFSSLKEKFMQSGCGSSQNGLKLKNGESLESQYKKVQRRLFDLECPADECISHKEGNLGVSAMSGVENYVSKRTFDVPNQREGKLSFHNGSSYNCNGDASNSNLCLQGTHGFANLNGPPQAEEAQRQHLSTRSQLGFQCLVTEFSQNSHKGREEGIGLQHLQTEIERRQKGWLSYSAENGHPRSTSSFCGSFHPEELHKQPKSVQVETSKVQPLKTETSAKRKIFGVEISERSNDTSVAASVVLNGTSASASHSLDQLANGLESDATNSKIFSVSTWKKFPSSWSQNLSGNPGYSTLDQINSRSITSMQDHRVAEGKLLAQSDSRSAPSLRTDRLYNNGLYFGAPSESKESRVCCPSVGFSNQNGTTALEQKVQHASRNNFKGLGSTVEAKSRVDLNMDALPVNGYQYESISHLNINGVEKQENHHAGLSWLRASPLSNGKATKGTEVSCQSEMKKGHHQSSIQDSSSATSVSDTDLQRREANYHSSNKKILGFPIFENKSKDMPSLSSPLKLTISASANVSDPLPPESGGCPMKGLVAGRGVTNQNADMRPEIDLNLCIAEEGIEEDAQPPSSSPKTNMRVAAVIDLEVRATIETETETTSGYESPESKLKKPFNSSQDESDESQRLAVASAAAEALVGLSSSRIYNQVDNAPCQQLNTPAGDSLHWFAEIISSYAGDSENDVGSASMGKDGTYCEEYIPYGLDYFEFMTLNLTETKVEECHNMSQVLENQKSEKSFARRPRRGQAKRGRQRKDFQRDVLPNLTSLSKNEVTHDLQKIEGLIQASGGNWQSSLTQKNNAKSISGRGRKRSAASAPPSSNAPCLNIVKQAEAVIPEGSITRWGKRTRRPPRQRCPIAINNPPLPVK